MTPPVAFQYDLDPTDARNTGNIAVTSVPVNRKGTISISNIGQFREGDILKFTLNGSIYYCVLISNTGVNTFNVVYLTNVPTGTAGTITASKTKNPPYNKDAYDLWGCYKADYVNDTNDDTKPNSNENLARATTRISNMSTDAWSLHKIISSLGAEITINYEGDTYSKSVMNKTRSIEVSNFTSTGTTNQYSMNIAADVPVYSFLPGTKVNFLLLKRTTTSSRDAHGAPGDPTISYSTVASDSDPSYNASVVSYSGNVLTLIASNALAAAIASRPTQQAGTTTTSILTGNLKLSGQTTNYGGGLRVRDIITDNLNGEQHKMSYNYNSINSASQSSSGITSFEPSVFDIDNAAQFGTDAKNAYRRELYKDINNLLPLSRELPAPGVMYEYVTVADSTLLQDATSPGGYRSIPVLGKTVYQYEVFNSSMLGIDQYYFYSSATQRTLNMSIKDYTSRIGNLKRMITYDDKGNKLTETQNHYLHDDLSSEPLLDQVTDYEPRLTAYNNQGIIQEKYVDRRIVYESGNADYKSVMSGRDVYPAIQVGSTQIDYKNGTTINQQTLGFDFYSGSILKTLTTDSYGNRFVNQIAPAYNIYPAMSLQTIASSNKHMLTQQASNYTYTVDANNSPLGIVTATVQTWSNTIPTLDPDGNTTNNGQSNIWRLEKNFSWMPFGSSANNVMPYASFMDYYSGGSSNPSWKKTSQITQYNVYSNALEGVDINNNYQASRMGYSNSKVIVTGSTARYNEIAYAGGEDALLTNGNFSNGISLGFGVIVSDSTKAHSGINSLKIPAGQTGFIYTVPITNLNPVHQNYSVAVWVKPAGANVNQAQLYYQSGSDAVVIPTQAYSKTAAGWYLLEMTIPAAALNAGNLVVGCKNASESDLYFDDFRFQPTASSAMAYVYDVRTGELNYILNNNNLYTRFQYDAIGRLVRTYKEVLGRSNIPLISAVQYNYGRFNH